MKSFKQLSLGSLMVVALLGAYPALSHADDMMKQGAMDGNAMMAQDMKTDVAIDGYCPVCVIHGMMNKGTENFTTEYKGKVYKFAGMDQQKMFLENPEMFTKDLDMKFKQLSGK